MGLRPESLEGMSFADFLLLVFKRLVMLVDSELHEVWITAKAEDFYPALYSLCEGYRDSFPLLAGPHWVTVGAFPHSGDVSDALQNLHFSGVLKMCGDDRRGILWYSDSEKEITAQLTLLLGVEGDDLRNRFDEMVQKLSRFEGFVVPSPISGRVVTL